MSLSIKIAYNTAIQIASKIISTVLGLFAIAIMTRYLGQEGFGQYTTVITFLSFFGIIADLGLTLVTVQMISQLNINQDKLLSNLFSLRFFSAIIFLGISPIAVLFFPYPPLIKIGVSIALLSFLFNALNQILVGLFQKNLRMDKTSIAEIIGRVALLLGIIIVARSNYGLVGVLWASVISSGINFLIHYFFSFKFAKIKFSFDINIWKEIIHKTWPLAITIFFNLIYLKADTLILSLIKTQSDVGLYGAAYRVVDVLITIPFMFVGIILPIITAQWAENNKEKFNNICQKSFDAMSILAVPLVVGTQLTARPIMTLIAGKEFAGSGNILQILILATGFIFLGSIFTHGIIAINKQKNIITAYIFTSITAVVGYLIFIPKYSYFGAAWMTVYSELAIALSSAYLVWKFTKFLPNIKTLTKTIISSAIMAGAIYFIPLKIESSYIHLFLILTIAVIVYFVSLYLLKGLAGFNLKK